MNWQRYLNLLSILLLASAVFATYRDIVDNQFDSWFDYTSRIVVCCLLALGLHKRNVWVVRLVYCFAIFCLVVFIFGSLAFGLPLSLLQMTAMILFIFPFSLTVLMPREQLRPIPPEFVAVGTSSDPSNPYSPPTSNE